MYAGYFLGKETISNKDVYILQFSPAILNSGPADYSSLCDDVAGCFELMHFVK